MTELRPEDGSTEHGRSCLIAVSSDSEHSDRASLLFLSGKLLSVIIEMEVGGETEGGGVKE